MRNIFVKKLIEKTQKDKNIFLLTADLGYKAFENFRSKFPSNFLNCGVAENNMIGLATGLSLSGKKVFIYGASTKGNTLLNFCNLDYNDINCVLDNSPHKIGKFMPGSGIKILDETKFKKYDAALILPWNITKHLYKKFLKNRKISYTSIAKIAKDL